MFPRQRVESHNHVHAGHARDTVVDKEFNATRTEATISSRRSRKYRPSGYGCRASNRTSATSTRTTVILAAACATCSCGGRAENVLEGTNKGVAGRLWRNDHHTRNRGIEGKSSHHRYDRCATVRKAL